MPMMKINVNRPREDDADHHRKVRERGHEDETKKNATKLFIVGIRSSASLIIYITIQLNTITISI